MNCWLQITAGRGPLECCWVVAQLTRTILADAQTLGMQVELLTPLPTGKGLFPPSTMLNLPRQEQQASFVRRWQGTVQWIGKSPFRPEHRRNNWFIEVHAILPPTTNSMHRRDLRIERMRASGPGGQHLNKTETAIRITHLPTGITAMAQEERSQHCNRNLALARLHTRLQQHDATRQQTANRHCWQHHNHVQRGNPRHIFTGPHFVLKQ